MTLDEARKLLFELTESPSLRRHARSVELVMRALARHFNEDEEAFAITGLLHDADYEKHPDKHPQVIVQHLRERGEERIAHAIAGHYTKWNVPRESLLDKCIVAADELTGFIVAAALIRPTRLQGLSAKSVLKKLKTKSFAASVDREEVYKGAELLGWELRELIEFIIRVLQEHAEELELLPTD
ncbi:MAG: HD domain-containing protein [Bacteroidetes bacterium]|nr:MAG: HD domain-containing protein [Bacteroidota bacterium]